MDTNLMEYSILEDSQKIDLFIQECDVFKYIIQNESTEEFINEGIDFGKIKERVKKIIDTILTTLKKVFDTIIGKIKEIFSKPIQESVNDTIQKKFKLAIKCSGAIPSEDQDTYICRVIDENLIKQMLSKVQDAAVEASSDLENVYNTFLRSTNSSTFYKYNEDDELEYDHYIRYPEKDIENISKHIKNKSHDSLVVITVGNLAKYEGLINKNVYESKNILNFINDMKKDCDNKINKMKQMTDALKEDKDENPNMEYYALFNRSCATYQKVIAKCASMGTSFYFSNRRQYVRCILKSIAVVKALGTKAAKNPDSRFNDPNMNYSKWLTEL